MWAEDWMGLEVEKVMSNSNIGSIVDVMKDFLCHEGVDKVCFYFSMAFEGSFCAYWGNRVTFFKGGEHFRSIIVDLCEGKYYSLIKSSAKGMNNVVYSVSGKRWDLMRVELDESGKVTVCMSFDVPIERVVT